MYLRNGKPMQYKEEGAAFFPPATPPSLGMVPPRTMGLHPGMLTHGFEQASGVGADAPATADMAGILSTPTPWVFAAVGAVAGFLLWRHK